MNLPNKLTLVRILMVPLILVFLLPLPEVHAVLAGWNRFVIEYGRLVALVFFILASLTDLLDGVIARRQNQVTTLGKFLDPIADKVLVISVFAAMVQLGRIHALVVIVVVIRELMISGIRLLASDHGVVIAASNLGKAKTVSQIVAILVILAEPVLFWLTSRFLDQVWIIRFGDVIVWISVVLTLVSGINYLKHNLKYFSAE